VNWPSRNAGVPTAVSRSAHIEKLLREARTEVAVALWAQRPATAVYRLSKVHFNLPMVRLNASAKSWLTQQVRRKEGC